MIRQRDITVHLPFHQENTMPSTAKAAGLDEARIEQLIRNHLMPFGDCVSLYSLQAAADLMAEIGKGWAYFGIDDLTLERLYQQSYADAARNIIHNALTRGLDDRSSMEELDELLQKAGLNYAMLGVSRAEIEKCIKPEKGPR
jgi:hypothetical protein